jgi:YVTN family beta-propeller protein
MGEKMKRNFTLLAAALGLFATAVLAAPPSEYHIIKNVPVPGTGGWDYVAVDESARRVYISHATQVEVMNADTFELVGTIPNTPGVHGIAIASEFGRGFITAGKSDSVVIFDLKTLKSRGGVKVGKKPDAILYDAATKHVYVMNGDSDSTTVINAADGKVVGTIGLGDGPEFAVADGKGGVCINLEEKAETVRRSNRCDPISEASSPFSFSDNKKSRRCDSLRIRASRRSLFGSRVFCSRPNARLYSEFVAK